MKSALPVIPGAADTLALVSSGVGAWRCVRARLEGGGRALRVRFEEEGTAHWVEVSVFPRADDAPAFRRLRHCAVAYRGAFGAASEAVKRDVGALVVGLAEFIDQRLDADPSRSIAEVFGGARERRRLVFGRDTLLSLLAPEVALGARLAGGWALTDVFPSSHLRDTGSTELELMLAFEREGEAGKMLFEVCRRDDARPAMVRTTNLQVSHLALGAPASKTGSELVTLLSFMFELRDHEGLELTFPDVLSDVVGLLPAPAPTPKHDDRVLNLAINAPCGQSCAFCSVLQLSPPFDGGDATLARLKADLESSRQQGVRRVRINGYDPLAYSRILEVLRLATDLGYEHADVFSPCTRLANPEFCRAVLEALPPSRRFFVPVYGATAEAHDALVGKVGSFTEVQAALTELRRHVDGEGIKLLCVATREGLGGMLEAARWAAAQGLRLSAHMPFPSSESRDDRYFTAAPRQTDAAHTMAQALAEGVPLFVNGLAPCVVLGAMRAQRVALGRWLDVRSTARLLPGTEYRERRYLHRAREAGEGAFAAATVPCPHVAECALSPACQRELLRSYVELHGTEEFHPVSVEALLLAGGVPEGALAPLAGRD